MSLGLNVMYQMKENRRDAYLEALDRMGLQKAVQQEEGCLQYDYFLSVQHPNELLLVERWTSQEAQQRHLKQPHMMALADMKPDYVESTTILSYILH